jgi:hypothetical protein
MKFTINGDPTEYQMLDTNVTFAEARAVEKVTGKAFQSLATDEAAAVRRRHSGVGVDLDETRQPDVAVHRPRRH